jgi:DNA-binding beta-propeller fold protein YncE
MRHALASLLALGLVATLSAAPSWAAQGHVFGKAFGSKGSGPGQFNEPAGAAVAEASGKVYVVDKGNNRVEWFSSTGSFEGQFNVPEPEAIAVDNACQLHKLTEITKPTCAEFDPSNGDVYVTSCEASCTSPPERVDVIDKFKIEGLTVTLIGQIKEPPHATATYFLRVEGVAVDPSGELWIAEEHCSADVNPCHIGSINLVDNFNNATSNMFLEARPVELNRLPIGGLAVDSKDDLYARMRPEMGEVNEFNSKGETLHERVDSEAIEFARNGIAAESSTDNVYIDNIGTVGRFDPKGSLIERFGAGHLPSGSCAALKTLEEREKCWGRGLAVDSASGQVYVAVGTTDEIQEYHTERPGPPTVEGETVLEVTGSDATLGAEVNPRSEPTEEDNPTMYSFEYGACASLTTCATSAYEASTPLASLSPSFAVDSVSAHVQGLHAGATYHFRVVAHNKFVKEGERVAGEGKGVAGEERTFTTQPSTALGLSDGRAWELVSPPDKHGAMIEPIRAEWLIQAAASGAAITYVTNAPTEAAPQGYTNYAQLLSTRGAGGWVSRDLALPNQAATGPSVGQGQEYRFFSEDLSLAVVQPLGAFDPLLSEAASEQTAYLRTTFLNGSASEPCLPPAMHCYRPLVTAESATSGKPFGEEGKCPQPNVICGPRFVGATPDLTHVVLSSNVGLTSTPGDGGGLYEWSAAVPPAQALQLVSVLPGKTPASTTTAPALGSKNEVGRYAISNDGSRVVWSEQEGEHHLYLRDTVKGETVQLDAGLAGTPVFQTANAELSRVFFTDGGDLYVYEVEQGKLVALSKGGKVHTALIGASEDGSYVYFVANGSLAAGAVSGTCEHDTAAEVCNLYTMRFNGTEWEPPALIAVLSGEDAPDWANSGVGANHSDPPVLTSRVSPDGRWLAFMSQRSLTGYDNRDAVSGRPDQEVYLYHATDGSIVCASCDPTGARPLGVEYQQINKQLVGGWSIWNDSTWLAATIPGWTAYERHASLYQSRYLSNDGRLFFNAFGALVPKDVNGTWDVYEYEPPGVGSCTTSSATFSERSRGCVGLISSGASPEESAFLDASDGGGDVFFLTAARLAPQDYDTALDVYDAHECTGASPCLQTPAPEPPPCATEASCKPAPPLQPDIFGAPASATFSGVGNLGPSAPNALTPRSLTRAQKLARALSSCRKRYGRSRRRRAACEHRARGRYGRQAASRATRVKG